MENLLHAQQTVAFLLGQGSGGNAGPSRDDGRNFIGRDLGRAVIALLLPIVFELFQLVTLILFLIAQLGSPLKVL